MPDLIFDFASVSAARSLRKIQRGNEANAHIERIRVLSELLNTADPAVRPQLEWALQQELSPIEQSRLWAQKTWWQKQIAMAVGPIWVAAIVMPPILFVIIGCIFRAH